MANHLREKPLNRGAVFLLSLGLLLGMESLLGTIDLGHYTKESSSAAVAMTYQRTLAERLEPSTWTEIPYQVKLEFPSSSSSSSNSSTTTDNATTNNNHNKTLVILMGNLRCGELAWQTLYGNLLDYNNADLALVTQPVNTSFYPNPSILHRARYVWTVPMYDDWADAVDLMNISDWRNVVPNAVRDPSLNSMLGGIGNHTGSNAILGMYKWWVMKLIEKHKLHERYDQFVITRNDHYYVCPYDLKNQNPNFVWVPFGEDYTGISDRFYVVAAHNVLTSLNMLYPILSDVPSYKWLYDRNIPAPYGVNSEYILKIRWKNDGLKTKRSARTMFTCAQAGETSRWGVPKELVPEGVHLKYKTEYTMSQENCHRLYNMTVTHNVS